MFKKITPEEAGISSLKVKKFIETLNRRGLATHSILLMKGNDIFAEYYWAPFAADICHRMYSQTKSYVSVAIGLLIEDGKLSLDQKIVELFPEKIHTETPEYLKNQTVRDMLLMATTGEPPYWFYHGNPDRTDLYLNENPCNIPSGMRFQYDSPGSQVLSSLVEKLSGQTLFDFLNDRIFKHLGTFKTASILKCANGDSWGDSALLCTTRDMASFGRFVMNFGTWNGKRLMNEAYLREATSKLIDNQSIGFSHFYNRGYGYQIWRVPENGFSFNGMGAQLTICLPDKDLIFVVTSDNQGYASAKDLILSAFYEIIVDGLEDAPLPADPENFAELEKLGAGLTLSCAEGNEENDLFKTLEGKTYICEENKTGIKKFSFVFTSPTEGVFRYTNAQGDKELPFGIGFNLFGKFPQLGYSNLYGTVPTEDGFMYNCAVSGVFRDADKLLLRVQIIDTYLGNAFFRFTFKDNCSVVSMTKTAEAFLDEYHGEFVAHLE